jgi:glycosyltransferase involved in cell wall biosynthesis
MRKTRIVVASILKPVSDTRMFGKLATTLAANDQYEVIVVGKRTNPLPQHSRVQFVCHPDFGRLSLRRLFAPFRVAVKLRKLQPDIIIAATHELLIPAISRKIASDVKVVYDVQENYHLNILHTNAFPPVVRNIVAWWVRSKELLSASFVDLFILAEKCYATELPFTAARSIVVENKAALPDGFTRQPENENIRLLFSGTLDESTGVVEAIGLAKSLHALDSRVQLHIIGYASRESTRRKLIDAARDSSFIQLTGISAVVEHRVVVEAIRCANFGVISYPSLPHIANRIGTKVYEYLAAGLPIIAAGHLKLASQFPDAAAIEIDLKNIDAETLLKKMRSHIPSPPDLSACWSKDAKELSAAIQQLAQTFDHPK